ncbi:MAG: GTPase domain-containing protein [Candidatus Thermoplasmatota archaeon]|nr:GTPase domain-containing protein [Candidatus Thermoplasmatota archaeon]MCL5799962.1 GTPase domain-containing protein [Candidatus Thermoplasmatota archaeon]
MENSRVTWKISVTGLNGSGKSTLISRLVYNTNTVSSQLRPIQRKIVTLDARNKRITAELLFLEINSEQESEKLLTGSNCILVVADLTSIRSLDYAENVLKFISALNNKTVRVLVATKLDRRYEAQFWQDELERVSKDYAIPYFILSNNSRDDWEKLYGYVTDKMIEVFVKK